jgi:hypothetical protein
MLKSRAVAAQALQVVPHLEGRPHLLTLTVRNVTGDKLSGMLTDMLDAWRRMRSVRVIQRNILAWARTLEITYNPWRNDYHPHIHAITYMSDNSMASGAYWQPLWRDLMGLDYNPIVDVRPIVDGTGAVYEVSKYVAKVGRILQLGNGVIDGVVRTLAMSVHGRRLQSYGGQWAAVRKVLRQQEIDRMSDKQVNELSSQLDQDRYICCGEPMADVILRWTGLDYEIVGGNDGRDEAGQQHKGAAC